MYHRQCSRSRRVYIDNTCTIGSAVDSTVENGRFVSTGSNGGELHPGDDGGGIDTEEPGLFLMTTAELIATD